MILVKGFDFLKTESKKVEIVECGDFYRSNGLTIMPTERIQNEQKNNYQYCLCIIHM